MKAKLLSGLLVASCLLISNNLKAGDNNDSIKTKISWSDYYPLHVGDFWIYYNAYSYTRPPYSSTLITIDKVTKDSVMPDGNTYYKFNQSFYRMDDTIGLLYYWYGDSANCGFPFDGGRTLPNNDTLKLVNGVYRFEYVKGIGLTFYEGVEGPALHRKELKGAYISGVVYGDTSYGNIGVVEEDFQATNYSLNQNYPNPFNPATNITFQLPKESFVSLIVYNVLGEEVETLLNEYRAVGKHTVTFDAHNLPSGIYFYTLQTNGLTETKKMLLIK